MMMTMLPTTEIGPSDPCSTAVHMKPFGLQSSCLNILNKIILTLFQFSFSLKKLNIITEFCCTFQQFSYILPDMNNNAVGAFNNSNEKL